MNKAKLKTKDALLESSKVLRQKAEDKIEQLNETPSLANIILSNDETKQLLYDLRLHQVELEMQNEELRQANLKLDQARANYYDIFEAAPVSYCTINKDGIILESNLSMSLMLGFTRNIINSSHLSKYIVPQDLELFRKHLASVLTSTDVVKFEFRMSTSDEKMKWMSVDMKCGSSIEKKDIVRVVLQDITKIKEQENSLVFLSYHDQLTSLYNRRFFEEELRRMDTQRQLPLSLIILDLNGLKLINDGYGHLFGDTMITKSAGILTSVCRDEDVIARWGGDEFIVLLPKTSEHDAIIIGDRIKKLAKETLVGDLPVSLALGVGTKSDMAENMDNVFTKAEDAMYFNKLLEHENARSTILDNFSKVLLKRSVETNEHIDEMHSMSLKLGERLGLSDLDLKKMEVLVRFHDIGNINVPENIFSKSGRLNEEEWDLVKKHCRAGYNILFLIPEFNNIAQDVLSHHEHWDGSGYPQGLRKLDIPLLARMISIIDAYVVMKNGRPYKAPMSFKMIQDEFKRCSGTQFDPDLIKVFLDIMNESDDQMIKMKI